MTSQSKLSVVTPQPFVIETGVPVPKRSGRNAGPAVLALRALIGAEIGASVFIPGRTAQNVGSYIVDADRKVVGWASARTVEGGVRVWKIAEPKLRA